MDTKVKIIKNNFSGNIQLKQERQKDVANIEIENRDGNIKLTQDLTSNSWIIDLNKILSVNEVTAISKITTPNIDINNIQNNFTGRILDLNNDWFYTQNDHNNFLNELKKYKIVNFTGLWTLRPMGYNVGDIVYVEPNKVFFISLTNANIDEPNTNSPNWGSFDYFNENEYYTKQEVNNLVNTSKLKYMELAQFDPQWTATLTWTAIGGWIEHTFYFKIPNGSQNIIDSSKVMKIVNIWKMGIQGLAPITFNLSCLDEWCIKCNFISSTTYTWESVKPYLSNLGVWYFE